ncbi:nucleotide exchange factor GrpE [Candidatus Blochmannia ocreatus (nom. nud.)]|uniref:Protein GrpE n=1 Tax=Candidatus Blochmannia ocreatus (nom. nud.) TaxID=251538 RepID=A0ABY4SXN2_9ENTR|nr:nucleotide exchange factor GrpE [Candidatus Blochmannia ocreatus]URJ25023.1 nucleotide exchange factor GrpE [Candidatus Blochmannia ocreatus]
MLNNNVKNTTEILPKTDKEELTESKQTVENIIDPKNEQIIKLKIQLAQLKEHERDIVLRLKAEIENIRRRNSHEIEKIHKFGLERFIFELLPVIDNLERTLNITDKKNTELSSIIEGIELTLKSFLDTVYKFGLKPIQDILVPFNPDIHQAISIVESPDHESNQVLTIIQKGYSLNNRLIRPAMVTVSQKKC